MKAGDVGPIEQQRADVLRINAQVAADSATRQAQAARANLETLLNAPVTGPLDRAWFERIDGYGPPRPSMSKGRWRSLPHRPTSAPQMHRFA